MQITIELSQLQEKLKAALPDVEETKIKAVLFDIVLTLPTPAPTFTHQVVSAWSEPRHQTGVAGHAVSRPIGQAQSSSVAISYQESEPEQSNAYPESHDEDLPDYSDNTPTQFEAEDGFEVGGAEEDPVEEYVPPKRASGLSALDKNASPLAQGGAKPLTDKEKKRLEMEKFTGLSGKELLESLVKDQELRPNENGQFTNLGVDRNQSSKDLAF